MDARTVLILGTLAIFAVQLREKVEVNTWHPAPTNHLSPQKRETYGKKEFLRYTA